MTATVATYSVLQLSPNVPGRLLFPGGSAIPSDCVGYVRARQRAAIAAMVRTGERRADQRPPWRDYADAALTHYADVLPRPFESDFVLVSARNCLNEFGHGVRIGGRWFCRGGDPPLPPDWPALRVSSGGTAFGALGVLEGTDDDLLTGPVLVQKGLAVSRASIVASCSDPAHCFHCHPTGRLPGTSAQAWNQLADTWQAARDDGVDETEITHRMDAVAGKMGAAPAGPLLHQVFAQRSDGAILLIAITECLWKIPDRLVALGVTHAVVADNSGSVTQVYCPKGADRGTLLLAGPNHRPAGTAWLALECGGYLQPAAHPSRARQVPD